MDIGKIKFKELKLNPRILSDDIISPIQYFPLLKIKIDLEAVAYISNAYFDKIHYRICFEISFRSDIPDKSSPEIFGWSFFIGSNDDHNKERYVRLVQIQIDEFVELWEKFKTQ